MNYTFLTFCFVFLVRVQRFSNNCFIKSLTLVVCAKTFEMGFKTRATLESKKEQQFLYRKIKFTSMPYVNNVFLKFGRAIVANKKNKIPKLFLHTLFCTQVATKKEMCKKNLGIFFCDDSFSELKKKTLFT